MLLKHKVVEVTAEEADRIASLEGRVFKDPNVHNMLSDIKSFLTWEASKSAAGDPVEDVEAAAIDQGLVSVAATGDCGEQGSDNTENGGPRWRAFMSSVPASEKPKPEPPLAARRQPGRKRHCCIACTVQKVHCDLDRVEDGGSCTRYVDCPGILSLDRSFTPA